MNISELVTLSPLAENQKLANIEEQDLGIIKNAWLHIKDGKVHAFGQGNPDKSILDNCKEAVDLSGKLIMPGLIDSHTHPVFYGDRSNEFLMRINGKTYAEIAEQGGGIKASMQHTKEASDKNLKEKTKSHLTSFLEFGVTTAEAKSGYGLTVEEELRHLRILKELKSELPLTLKTTCLALHAIPEGYASENEYVEKVAEPVLEEASAQQLCDYVDAFIENGYFSVDGVKEHFKKVKESGLQIRLHADEFSDASAASFAAEMSAKSADHLQFASDSGIEKMAKNKVVATILPGTSIYTNIPFTNAKKFTDKGCPVAVATDFNPGSCVINNLPQIATIASLHCGLDAAHTVSAVTFVPAYSLGLAESKGALASGYDADFLIHDSGSLAGWLADIGRTKPSHVYIGGKAIIYP